MHVAQSGIFALGTGSHSSLEFDLHVYSDRAKAISRFCEPYAITASMSRTAKGS